jgi:hypothetical protein
MFGDANDDREDADVGDADDDESLADEEGDSDD